MSAYQRLTINHQGNANMTQTRMIEIARIEAGDRLRALDPDWVTLLVEEIGQDGLQSPIRIVERATGFKLVDGARRLAAVQALGYTEIEAKVEPAKALLDDAAVRLGEIKGNMLRGELTALDHAVYVAGWCDIYRGANEAPKRGPKKAVSDPDITLDEFSAAAALNWTEAAQRALQISRRSVFVALKIAGIDREMTRRIALLPVAKRQNELLTLAVMTPARQLAVVGMLTAEPAQATSVTEAIALLDSVPQPKAMPAYERFYQKFASLKVLDKERFYELNSVEIEAWFAKRSGSHARKAAV